MRILLLTTVAVSALAVGLATATAQQEQAPRGNPPAAEQSQQTPDVSRKSKERPGSQVQQQEPQRQGPARVSGDRSTTGQSGDSQANQPNHRERRRDARDKGRDQTPSVRERTGEDRSLKPAREQTTTGQSQERRDITGETPRRGETRQGDATRDRQQNTQQDKSRPNSATRLSDEQRTRVTTRFSNNIERLNVRPLSRSQISISIGASIPRSVRAYAVPSDIVAIYPRFRGHRFVVVEDEIVIIEPRRYRVVTVLPMGDRRAARSTVRETTGTASAGPRLRLSQQERETIRTVVMREPACRLEQRLDFVLFIPVPRTVEICELPSQIVSEVPEVSRYRYIVRGDEVALVDPEDYRVIEVIR